MERTSDYEELAAALETMNNVSLHQTSRVFPPMEVGGVKMPMRLHPLTCGNNSNHGSLYPYWNGARVQLICPDCDYTQDNAGPCAVSQDQRHTGGITNREVVVPGDGG